MQCYVPASPAQPRCELESATQCSNPSVSVLAMRFKTGQELMMDFFFIYIFMLLTGKFERGRVLTQL